MLDRLLPPIKAALIWLTGWREEDHSYWSNFRRLISRGSILVIIALFAEVIFVAANDQTARPLAWIFMSFAVYFFGFHVLAQPFVHGAKVDARRLFADALISSALMILAFALVYRANGIIPPYGRTMVTAVDSLYFSAVTFSMLGFGDFTPNIASQAWAGGQAILGNLHLGFIVGATFAVIR